MSLLQLCSGVDKSVQNNRCGEPLVCKNCFQITWTRCTTCRCLKARGNSVGYDRLQYDKLREAQVEGIDQNRNNPPRRGIG